MQTRIITAQNHTLSQNDLCEAAGIIRAGGLVVFPTETVYGLGGDATNARSSEKIYAAKGRPSDNPLIIHVYSPEDTDKYAVTNETYFRLAKAFMPGPLTVILPRREIIPTMTTGGLETVAVRCPSHPVARALIKESGVPIAAPSANLSGKPSPTCARHVIEDLSGRVDMIIDGGECDIGLESTIIKLDGAKATLLRPGAITADALRCVCDEVVIAPAVLEQIGANEHPLSPGMKYKHYAPSVPFVLLDGTKENVIAFLQNEQKTKSCAVLCYSEEMTALGQKNIIDIGKSDDLDVQAKRLFTALRDADKLGVEVIYGHLPPKDGLGLALYNRMIRAAAHTILQV